MKHGNHIGFVYVIQLGVGAHISRYRCAVCLRYKEMERGSGRLASIHGIAQHPVLAMLRIREVTANALIVLKEQKI